MAAVGVLVGALICSSQTTRLASTRLPVFSHVSWSPGLCMSLVDSDWCRNRPLCPVNSFFI